MINMLIVAAFLMLVDLRLGFNDEFLPKLLFDFSKNDTWWLDFDLLPTFIGAILIIIVASMLQRREERLATRPAKRRGAVLFVLSLIAFVQFSGHFIAALNRQGGTSVFNPGFVADILYSAVDIICYCLAATLLGEMIDLLMYEVSLRETPDRKLLMERATPFAMYYRTFCAFPVFIRVFMAIMNWDESSTLSLITAVLYHAICIFSAVMFALFVKKIEVARRS